jgi:hypothetical protein
MKFAIQLVLIILGGLLLGFYVFEGAADPRGSLGLLCLLVAGLWYIKREVAERERFLVQRIYRLEQQAAERQNEGVGGA